MTVLYVEEGYNFRLDYFLIPFCIDVTVDLNEANRPIITNTTEEHPATLLLWLCLLDIRLEAVLLLS